MSIDLRLESIECPIPLRESHLEPEIRKNLNQWILKFQLVKGTAGLERFSSYLTERAICCSMPSSSPEILQPLCNFTGWLIITDDYYDEDQIGQNIETLEKAFQRFAKIVNGDIPEETSKIEDALIDVTGEIRELNQPMYEQFAKDCCTYWEACIVEAKVRKNKTPVRRDYYFSYRIATLAMDMLYDFIIPDRGLKIDILANEHVQNIRLLASKIITVQNDILSFPKEHAHQDPNNYVACLVYEKNLSHQDALDEAIADHNQLMNEVKSLSQMAEKRQLEPLPEECRTYVIAMRDWVAGVFDWHMSSHRYHHKNNSNTVLVAPLA